jgi:hypothetical protein
MLEIGDGLEHFPGRELLHLRFEFGKNHRGRLGGFRHADKNVLCFATEMKLLFGVGREGVEEQRSRGAKEQRCRVPRCTRDDSRLARRDWVRTESLVALGMTPVSQGETGSEQRLGGKG